MYSEIGRKNGKFFVPEICCTTREMCSYCATLVLEPTTVRNKPPEARNSVDGYRGRLACDESGRRHSRRLHQLADALAQQLGREERTLARWFENARTARRLRMLDGCRIIRVAPCARVALAARARRRCARAPGAAGRHDRRKRRAAPSRQSTEPEAVGHSRCPTSCRTLMTAPTVTAATVTRP